MTGVGSRGGEHPTGGVEIPLAWGASGTTGTTGAAGTTGTTGTTGAAGAAAGFRFGVDLGGTKIAALLLDTEAKELWRKRIPTPRGDYSATVRAIAALLAEARHVYPQAARCSVGVGIPGSLGPDGRVRNANSVWLNGKDFAADLEQALGQAVAMANDANCLALSESADGAGADCESMFAVILGTGVGGGLVLHRRLWQGAGGLAGEWGHIPLPWPRLDWGECPGPQCWCGNRACIECFLSGPALARDAQRTDDDAQRVVVAAEAQQAAAAWEGDLRVTDPHRADLPPGAAGWSGGPEGGAARQAVERYLDRLARALAMVITIIDPEVIVLGGGMSQYRRLYQEVPRRWHTWTFSDRPVRTRLLPALHGDDSGVRGAAWLGASADAGAGTDAAVGADAGASAGANA